MNDNGIPPCIAAILWTMGLASLLACVCLLSWACLTY